MNKEEFLPEQQAGEIILINLKLFCCFGIKSNQKLLLKKLTKLERMKFRPQLAHGKTGSLSGGGGGGAPATAETTILR